MLSGQDFQAYYAGLAIRLDSLGLGNPVRGCTEEEIQLARERWGGSLPASFEAFLRVLGADAGPLWRDSCHLMPRLLELELSWLAELADELGVTLPDGELELINGHGGYEFQFLAMTTLNATDPPVWQLLETVNPPLRLLSAAYSLYVADAIAATEDFHRSHPSYDAWNDEWPGEPPGLP